MMSQRDRYSGDSVTRGAIPQSARIETEADRIAELTRRANTLPPESTSRQNIINVLRRDYGITVMTRIL